eukprot:7433221-Ditylum_brightwellii.AAC.1
MHISSSMTTCLKEKDTKLMKRCAKEKTSKWEKTQQGTKHTLHVDFLKRAQKHRGRMKGKGATMMQPGQLQ